jgi:hypothetical protein
MLEGSASEHRSRAACRWSSPAAAATSEGALLAASSAQNHHSNESFPVQKKLITVLQAA